MCFMGGVSIGSYYVLITMTFLFINYLCVINFQYLHFAYHVECSDKSISYKDDILILVCHKKGKQPSIMDFLIFNVFDEFL